ncbi:hypothetical protein DSECCO2_457080 [anaerobic digester metagenome]
MKKQIKKQIKKTNMFKDLENRNQSLENRNQSLENQVKILKDRAQNLERLRDNLKAENKSIKDIYVEKNCNNQCDYDSLTVVIPYRETDDIEREENIEITLRYLSKVGISNLIISEHSDVLSEKFLVKKYENLFNSFTVIFSNANGTLFNKAHAINEGVIASKTPYIAIMDIDCLTEKKNIELAINLLEKGFEVVHPFNRVIKDIVNKEEFKREYDFKTVQSPPQYRDWADGGIVFWNKRSFMDIGMKNEYFSGWGGEDNEIIIRASVFQLKQIRIDETLYHLYHDRPQIRTKNNVEQINKIEEIKSKKELLKEICEWPWIIKAKN